MISDRMQKALNEQLNVEFHSGYEYLSMSAYFQSINLNGFAHWMRIQAREELAHAMKIYDFINEREGRVELLQMEAPGQTWDNPLDVFENAYRNEQGVTTRIYNLVDLSLKERDHATHTFLQWFVNEQVEEESTAGEIVHNLKLVGDDGNGLFLLDRDLGQRTPSDAHP